MTNTELERIVRELISAKIQAGEIVQMHWAVQEIIQGQGAIEGDGVDFYTLCAREQVYRVVKKAVELYDKKEETDDRQLVLEGFDHLQKAYTVERDGERTLVPVQLISDAELLARAEEYDQLARGLRDHAKEIRRYVASRHSTKAA